ncbi:MAG TPA: hypothetical protein V6D27_00925 [Vampirovibrionales bacterium]
MGFWSFLFGGGEISQFTAPSYSDLNAQQTDALYRKRVAEHRTEMTRLDQAKKLTEMDQELIQAKGELEKAELKTVRVMGRSYYSVLGEKARTTKAIEGARKSYKAALKGR